MYKQEFEKISTNIDNANKLQIEKFKNEAYFLKCEKDQLKLQLSQLSSIKEKYDESLEKLKRKYGSKKEQLKGALKEIEILEKSNNELKEKIQIDTDQVILKKINDYKLINIFKFFHNFNYFFPLFSTNFP